jgi:hypothetical protein
MANRHDDNHPLPVGALAFMAVYLLFLALGWLNVYLRLWF